MFKVELPLPAFSDDEYVVPEESGDRLYVFDTEGRHLRTMDTVTGQAVYTFEYDESGHLERVMDLDGDETVIERDGDGLPRAIVGPDGGRTEFKTDDQGNISEIVNPAGEVQKFTYDEGGLLTRTESPRGLVSKPIITTNSGGCSRARIRPAAAMPRPRKTRTTGTP